MFGQKIKIHMGIPTSIVSILFEQFSAQAPYNETNIFSYITPERDLRQKSYC